MEKITDIQILCLNRNCIKWFKSPIFFGRTFAKNISNHKASMEGKAIVK